MAQPRSVNTRAKPALKNCAVLARKASVPNLKTHMALMSQLYQQPQCAAFCCFSSAVSWPHLAGKKASRPVTAVVNLSQATTDGGECVSGAPLLETTSTACKSDVADQCQTE